MLLSTNCVAGYYSYKSILTWTACLNPFLFHATSLQLDPCCYKCPGFEQPYCITVQGGALGFSAFLYSSYDYYASMQCHNESSCKKTLHALAISIGSLQPKCRCKRSTTPKHKIWSKHHLKMRDLVCTITGILLLKGGHIWGTGNWTAFKRLSSPYGKPMSPAETFGGAR